MHASRAGRPTGVRVRQRLAHLLDVITGAPSGGTTASLAAGPGAPVDAVLLWPAVARVPGAARRLHGDLHPPT